MQSCTSGRNAFFTACIPCATGMIRRNSRQSHLICVPGTPALAVFLRDLGYTTGEFGKNHLGDHPRHLPTAHGFQEYWGAISTTSTPCRESVSPTSTAPPPLKVLHRPARTTPIPGVPKFAGAVDPKTTTCLTPPRPVLWCHSSDGTEKNQMCKDQGP